MQHSFPPPNLRHAAVRVSLAGTHDPRSWTGVCVLSFAVHAIGTLAHAVGLRSSRRTTARVSVGHEKILSARAAPGRFVAVRRGSRGKDPIFRQRDGRSTIGIPERKSFSCAADPKGKAVRVGAGFEKILIASATRPGFAIAARARSQELLVAKGSARSRRNDHAQPTRPRV